MIFLLIYCVFIWMPTVLVMQQDEVMTLSGCFVLACVLIFLIRRAESNLLMAYADAGMMTVALADILSRNDNEIHDPKDRTELFANAKQVAEQGANVVKMLLQ